MLITKLVSKFFFEIKHISQFCCEVHISQIHFTLYTLCPFFVFLYSASSLNLKSCLFLWLECSLVLKIPNIFMRLTLCVCRYLAQLIVDFECDGRKVCPITCLFLNGPHLSEHFPRALLNAQMKAASL